MNIKKPDIIIGCSGSTGTSLCYLADQKEIIKEVWCNSLSTSKFLSFWRFWKILDINYLIDFVLKKENPLNMKKISKSEIVAYFPLTNSKTGEIKYFSNKMGANLYEVMRASISVPLWTNLFSIKGNFIDDAFYADSIPASRFELHIQKAVEEGARKIIVFDNWHPEDNPFPYFAKLFTYIVKNKEFKKNQLNYFRRTKNFSIPKDIEFVKLIPSEKLSMNRWNIDNENARKIFQRGYDDTFNNEKLQEIL